jgi:hypothetical protein
MHIVWPWQLRFGSVRFNGRIVGVTMTWPGGNGWLYAKRIAYWGPRENLPPATD